MTIEFAAATRGGMGTGPAPIISSGSSGRMISSGTTCGTPTVSITLGYCSKVPVKKSDALQDDDS